MRRLLIAASTATLTLFGGVAGANAAMPGTGVRAAAAELSGVTPVARVCREVCRGGYCRERCWNQREYDNDGYVERRRVYRTFRPAPRYYYTPAPRHYYGGYYDRAPGFGIYGPGVGIEIGPRW